MARASLTLERLGRPSPALSTAPGPVARIVKEFEQFAAEGGVQIPAAVNFFDAVHR